jgi:hypothetical protein
VRSKSHSHPPALPPEDQESDEEHCGTEARESDDLGTSTGAASAKLGLSLEAHVDESASDRQSILEAYERKKAKYQDLASTFRERFGRQGCKYTRG